MLTQNKIRDWFEYFEEMEDMEDFDVNEEMEGPDEEFDCYFMINPADIEEEEPEDCLFEDSDSYDYNFEGEIA